MANPRIISDKLSFVYAGGGTDNLLLAKATSADIVASAAEVIATGYCDVLEVWLMNSTAAQSGSLVVSEFSDAVPTVGNEIRRREIPISATDQTSTTDRAAWGLTTATSYTAKNPLRIPVRPGTFVKLHVAAGATWYTRVTGRVAGIAGVPTAASLGA